MRGDPGELLQKGFDWGIVTKWLYLNDSEVLKKSPHLETTLLSILLQRLLSTIEKLVARHGENNVVITLKCSPFK